MLLFYLLQNEQYHNSYSNRHYSIHKYHVRQGYMLPEGSHPPDGAIHHQRNLRPGYGIRLLSERQSDGLLQLPDE